MVKPPTISDVAELAGVSAPTVSRVLNDTGYVKETTRSKVEAAIDALDYRPSASARTLRTGRTSALACVVPFVAHPSAIDHVRGLVEGLHGTDTPLSLYNVETVADLTTHINHLHAVAPAGLVVVALQLEDDVLVRFAERQVPVVLIDTAHPAVSSVTLDEHAGAARAAAHLLELGHTRIAFVGDDESNEFGFTSSKQRRIGLRRALADAGLELPARYVRRGPHGRRQAEAHTRELLDLATPPTAVLAASDTQALGALDAVRRAGLVPGQDVSVVGFDDIEVAEDLGLTTVDGQLRRAGLVAAEILRSQMARPDEPPDARVLDAPLVVRTSTGPAPGEVETTSDGST